MPTHLVLDGVDLSLQPLDGPVHLRNLIPGIPEVISMLPSPGLEGLKLERPYREVWQGVENDYGRFISLPTQGRPMVVGDKPSWLIFPRRDSMTPSNPHPMPGDQTLGSGLGLSVLPAQEALSTLTLTSVPKPCRDLWFCLAIPSSQVREDKDVSQGLSPLILSLFSFP